jgi:hypothetical protein
VHQSAESLGVDNLIHIPLKDRSDIFRTGFFRVESAPGFISKGRFGI